MVPLWLVSSIIGLLAAGVGRYVLQKPQQPDSSGEYKPPIMEITTPLPTNSSSTYAIGDLHGDDLCARYWVEKLNLIDVNNGNNWKDPHTRLVFMGDYIDKGPHGYAVLDYVRNLTLAYPTHITALLGNHEMELLRDRQHHDGGTKYLQHAYSAVHPAEYLYYLDREVDADDAQVVDYLLRIGLEIYARGWQQSILLSPLEPGDVRLGRYHSVLEILPDNDALRSLVQSRLLEYQDQYLRAFASNATLGQWLETRPVVHVENDAIFVHGGLTTNMAQVLAQHGADAWNADFYMHSSDTQLVEYLQGPGRLVYESVLYRGNHQNCHEVASVLETLQLSHLVVGHTPGESVRVKCADSFWAIDSLLGRYIRTSGNYYCPDDGGASRDGQFVCPKLPTTCQGQVIRIQNGQIEVVEWTAR